MGINALIKKYEQEIDLYRSQSYNETQLRTDFLDPLFSLLGWDITNQSGKSTNEREVLVEESLKGKKGEASKKPDYTFRHFASRKFFLEAKKPSVNIESDPSPAKQLRRYGFTSKLKISILSNFEYLAIYDCSSQVSESDTASNYRVKIYHYTEYEEKIDELRSLMGKEAVYDGAFDKAWEDIEDKIQRFSVDQLFLEQINQWRLNLAKNFLKIKPSIGCVEINDLTQSYINSIVFLRACEERDLEDYETLLKLSNDNDFEGLIKKFQLADKKYNSGLFSLPYIESFFSDKNSYIWKIFKSLYYPESTYSFAVFSSDILGNIYETFLGQSVIVSDGVPTLRPKPENLDRDIVTTPTHIIRGILKKTIEPKLKKANSVDIFNFQIADISCGSGAFLLEAYQLMQDSLIDFYIENDTNNLVQVAKNQYRLKFEDKKRILEKCIFGVDKDYSAVQACKFGLLLKLLEDENNSTISSPALPVLDENINFGNSLIDEGVASQKNYGEINPYSFESRQFDAIIGNPPYLSTENMKAITPTELPIYKRKYKSAYKQFDKYFLFVEKALDLLKGDGVAGYIIPSKFMKVGAGQELRGLLGEGRFLKEIVSFGAIQIFDDKTTYTCILILGNEESKQFQYTEVPSVNDWLSRKVKKENSNTYPATHVGKGTWVLMPESLEPAFHSIMAISRPLGEIIGEGNISNGIQTSANRIYVHTPHSEDSKYYYFVKDGKTWKVEKDLTRPYFKTAKKDQALHSHREFKANAFVIYPYKNIDGHVNLVELSEIKRDYPFLFAYLIENEPELNKASRDIKPTPRSPDEWHRYGRHQSLETCAVPLKIIVGVLSQGNKYAIDYNGALISSGGTAGYSMITIPENLPYSVYYIQALLNSKYGEWFASLYGEVFRGGYIARGTKVFKNLPIVEIDFQSTHSKNLHDAISKTQKELISAFTDIDHNKSNPREKIKSERMYNSLLQKQDNQLKELFGLGDLDSRIPIISNLY